MAAVSGRVSGLLLRGRRRETKIFIYNCISRRYRRTAPEACRIPPPCPQFPGPGPARTGSMQSRTGLSGTSGIRSCTAAGAYCIAGETLTLPRSAVFNKTDTVIISKNEKKQVNFQAKYDIMMNKCQARRIMMILKRYVLLF